MALYGIGEAFKQGVEGYNAGVRAVDERDMNEQRLRAAQIEEQQALVKAGREQKLYDEADSFKSAFNKNINDPARQNPLFSEATNTNMAGLLAAKATGNPALIAKYEAAHTQSAKQDMFGATVEVLNQAKNADGAIDFQRLNDMYRNTGQPIQIIRADRDGVLAEGPNGVRQFTVDGFLNLAAQALNPATAYGNLTTQQTNEQATVLAQRQAIAKREENNANSANLLEKQRRADEAALTRTKTLVGGRSDDEDKKLQGRKDDLASREAYQQRTVDEKARATYLKTAEDPKAALLLFEVERRHNEYGEDPYVIAQAIKQMSPGISKKELIDLLGAGGVGKPRRPRYGGAQLAAPIEPTPYQDASVDKPEPQ